MSAKGRFRTTLSALWRVVASDRQAVARRARIGRLDEIPMETAWRPEQPTRVLPLCGSQGSAGCLDLMERGRRACGLGDQQRLTDVQPLV
jgi:hypothetical protein